MRLACGSSDFHPERSVLGRRGGSVGRLPPAAWPSILIAYPYIRPFLANQLEIGYRDWSLDSGAFSAFCSGELINLQKYGETCLHLLATDPTLIEVFTLDVIGDERGSLANTERLWSMGVPAIPVWHAGDSEELLRYYAKTFPKIALGGAVRLKKAAKLEWARRAFGVVWKAAGPTRIHGLGFGSADHMLALPFDSTDATNWSFARRFGNWQSMRGRVLGTRGAKGDLRAEVEHFLRIEREARSRWRRESAEFAAARPWPLRRYSPDARVESEP